MSHSVLFSCLERGLPSSNLRFLGHTVGNMKILFFLKFISPIVSDADTTQTARSQFQSAYLRAVRFRVEL
jgi:hypothetical protein